MLTILIAAAWLVVVVLVLGACCIAARCDQAVEQLARGGRAQRTPERRSQAHGNPEVALLPSQPA
jgi:hypothetical protein